MWCWKDECGVRSAECGVGAVPFPPGSYATPPGSGVCGGTRVPGWQAPGAKVRNPSGVEEAPGIRAYPAVAWLFDPGGVVYLSPGS